MAFNHQVKGLLLQNLQTRRAGAAAVVIAWTLAGFADVMRCELAETPAVAVRYVE